MENSPDVKKPTNKPASEWLESLQADLTRWTNGYDSVAPVLVDVLPAFVEIVKAAELVDECADALTEDGYAYLVDAAREALGKLP